MTDPVLTPLGNVNMPKKPSPETELLKARREISFLQTELREQINQLAKARAQAARAEQEATEWKQRFDELLRRCKLTPAD